PGPAGPSESLGIRLGIPSLWVTTAVRRITRHALREEVGVSEHESPPSVTKTPSSGLSRLYVLKAGAASAVGAIALALAASGLGAPAPQRIRPPVTPPGTLLQLPGSSGCLVDRATPRRGCQPVRAVRGPGPLLGSHAVALSPDGNN